MGLFQRALETYDAMAHLVGVEQEGQETLAPVGHLIAHAVILITVDADGNFISAEAADKKIPIAVTEESSGRTSAPAAHCLCEQIGYVCSQNPLKHDLYLTQLRDWSESAYSNPKVSAILRYVEKGTVQTDLSASDLLKTDEKGGIQNEKDLICWSVIGLGDADGPVWTDPAVQQSFSAYYGSRIGTKEPQLCMVTGQKETLASQHLKGVVPLNGNAKLISANDTTNYTYRGRFLDDAEALTVGYTASQKAHNALKWLVATQGVVQGGREFLCWNPNGRKVPGALDVFYAGEDRSVTMENYRKKLSDTLFRCRQEIPDQEPVIFCAFDAATTGRLAIAYYSEFSAKDFLERLRHWDETSAWFDVYHGVSAPSLYRIVLCAFGTERSAKGLDLDDRILRQQLQRLLFCRVEKKMFPPDIMRAIVQKAGNLQLYDKKTNRNRILTTACAVVKKYRFDRFGEEWNLALDRDKKDRSYQYGRLLAVLDKIEGDVLRKHGEDRDTNALRMQSVFVRRPAYAFKILMDQLKTAYYPRSLPGSVD